MNLNPFKLPTVAQQAASDLALAELELLKAHTTAEHATAMLGYHQQRAARLRALVAAHDAAQCDDATRWSGVMNFGGAQGGAA